MTAELRAQYEKLGLDAPSRNAFRVFSSILDIAHDLEDRFADTIRALKPMSREFFDCIENYKGQCDDLASMVHHAKCLVLTPKTADYVDIVVDALYMISDYYKEVIL